MSEQNNLLFFNFLKYRVDMAKCVRVNVVNKSGNNFKTLQKFKNRVNDEGILSELKKREFFIKPSLKKKLKRENAERQRVKDLHREIKNLEKNSDEIFF
jgi:small subunit ribosomal protein S21